MNTARWSKVRLGDVLTKKSDWINIDPDADYRQVTVKMWGQGVTLRRIVKGSDIAASSQVKVQATQFIVSKIDARHGAFGIVPDALDGAVVSQDFPVFETDEKRLLPEFLGWMSKTDWFVDLCRVASEGSTNRVRLREDRFLNHVVPLPPMPEQRRIIQSLNAVARAIETRTREVTIVEAELAKTLSAGFHKITAGAHHVRIGDVAPLVRRAIEIDPDATYTELGVRSFYKGTFHRRTVKGAEFTWQKLFRVHQGDLVFSNLMAWEQAIAVARDVDHQCVGNHRMLTCEVDASRCTPNFLLYYFTTDVGFAQVLDASPGSIARNKTLSAVQLPELIVPLPPLESQLWFDELQAKGRAARARSAEAAAELGRLIPALLNQAF